MVRMLMRSCSDKGLMDVRPCARLTGSDTTMGCVFVAGGAADPGPGSQPGSSGGAAEGGMDKDLGGDRWEGDDFGGDNSGAQSLHSSPVPLYEKSFLEPGTTCGAIHVFIPWCRHMLSHLPAGWGDDDGGGGDGDGGGGSFLGDLWDGISGAGDL